MTCYMDGAREGVRDTVEYKADCYASGTTASAHSSSEAHSVHLSASSSPSSSSSGERGQSGQVSDSVREELGRNVIACVTRTRTRTRSFQRLTQHTELQARDCAFQRRPPRPQAVNRTQSNANENRATTVNCTLKGIGSCHGALYIPDKHRRDVMENDREGMHVIDLILCQKMLLTGWHPQSQIPTRDIFSILTDKSEQIQPNEE